VEAKRREGKSVSHLHLKYINPFQRNVGEILYNFKNVLVPELNLGQLSRLLRAKYLIPALSLNKVQGLPFMASEIEDKIDEII
jgi:2-oxoglutarate ferredoxin oxidoreductase subunit alpha